MRSRDACSLTLTFLPAGTPAGTRPDHAALLEYIRSSQCDMVSLGESSRGSRQMGEWVRSSICAGSRRAHPGVRRRRRPADVRPAPAADRKALLRQGMAAEAEVERLARASCPGSRTRPARAGQAVPCSTATPGSTVRRPARACQLPAPGGVRSGRSSTRIRRRSSARPRETPWPASVAHVGAQAERQRSAHPRPDAVSEWWPPEPDAAQPGV